MNPSKARGVTAALLISLLAIGCLPAKTPEQAAADATTMPAAHDMSKMAGMDGMSAPVTIPKGAIQTEADVHFMQGMIAHHAQAIFMSRLAAKHQASARLQKFATKIDQSQTTEIKLMQDWLRANGQMTPDTSSYHTVMMSGMLTAEQIKMVEGSWGAEFDRQFLMLMIQHHEGALKMVEDLCGNGGVQQASDHMSGVRIFDVKDPAHPSWSRTCRPAKARTRTRSSRARRTRTSSMSPVTDRYGPIPRWLDA